MSRRIRPPLDPETQAALGAYAVAHGRRWKSNLLADWQNGAMSGVLQGLRNSHGSSWLVSFRIGARKPLPTLQEIVTLHDDAFTHRFISDARRRPPRLEALAAMIDTFFPDLEVRMDTWSYEPFQKVGRLRRVTGRRRDGKRLLVLRRNSEKGSITSDRSALLDHKSSDPYRNNWDVVRWIAEEARRRKLA